MEKKWPHARKLFFFFVDVSLPVGNIGANCDDSVQTRYKNYKPDADMLENALKRRFEHEGPVMVVSFNA